MPLLWQIIEAFCVFYRLLGVTPLPSDHKIIAFALSGHEKWISKFTESCIYLRNHWRAIRRESR